MGQFLQRTRTTRTKCLPFQPSKNSQRLQVLKVKQVQQVRRATPVLQVQGSLRAMQRATSSIGTEPIGSTWK